VSAKSEREWEQQLRAVLRQLPVAELFELREVIARRRLAALHVQGKPHQPMLPLFERTWIWLPSPVDGEPRIIGAELSADQ
jgi:hypothetical protein